ncbi:hypothetical protein AAFP35_04065 [Gordonia sp. CPCC 206044]|uniref:hypothetical protein n=1 Tax=Gordonia sp. CPCC 206044 TaxID=3140793 RepID=UPI003AF366C0
MRATTGVIAAAAAVVLMAGCGDSDSADSADATSAGPGAATAADAQATVPAKDLVLTKADLPAGYQVMPIPQSQVQQAADNLVNSMHGGSVEPAKCAPPKAIPDHFDVSKIGMLVAASGSSTLTESVMPGSNDLGDMREAMTGDCAKVSATMAAGEAAGVSTTIEYAPLEVPDLKADDVFAVKQTSTSTVNGQKVNATSFSAWAVVNGYSVAVSSGGALGTPDADAFESILTKAVDKVAAA